MSSAYPVVGRVVVEGLDERLEAHFLVLSVRLRGLLERLNHATVRALVQA